MARDIERAVQPEIQALPIQDSLVVSNHASEAAIRVLPSKRATRRFVTPQQLPEEGVKLSSVSPTDESVQMPLTIEALQVHRITHKANLESLFGPRVTDDDFEVLFGHFQGPITSYLTHLLGNIEQASDVAQDVFTNAYKALSGGTTIERDAISSWLYRIAHNLAVTEFRRRNVLSLIPFSQVTKERIVAAGLPIGTDEKNIAFDGAMFPNTYADDRFEDRTEDAEIIARILSKLPSDYAKSILLYEYEGFSMPEVAHELQVSDSAVKMLHSRAKRQFRELYVREKALMDAPFSSSDALTK